MADKKITLRQYLVYYAMGRGATTAQADDYAERFKTEQPHRAMSERRSWDEWEASRESGTLAV